MRIIVISLFPKMVENFLEWGIIHRAIEKKYAGVKTIDLRDFALNRYGRIDDRPYGGGPGMVLQYQPLRDAIVAAKDRLPDAPVVYLSPQSRPFDQRTAQAWSASDRGLILLCGRYEGIDERVVQRWVDVEVSIGPYVLSGGEVAAMVVIESCLRLIPGVVGSQQSVLEESHSQWSSHDHPHYTRPESIDGMTVPKTLLQGNHNEIALWRKKWRAERRRKSLAMNSADLVE